jgi:NADPH:quinone reductase
MPHAFRVEAAGDADALKWTEVALADPGPGEVRLRHTAIGVNFIDVYQRTGLYAMEMPFTPGQEAAGVVEAVGDGVEGLTVGDRVVYEGALGSYAEARNLPADKVVALPYGIDDRTAAAVFLKGLTVEFLIKRTFPIGKEHTILWHAAAGGVGLIACQWASALGATVIGTAGSAEKVARAKAAGCAHVINYREEDFVARVREITGGQGVDVAFDSVGKDTFPGSVECLRPRGMWVAFGQSSGMPPPFQTSLLRKGSLFVTRPVLFDYVVTRADLETAAAGLFDVLRSGKVKVDIGQEFPLKEAAAAHRALESRQTMGSTLLIP